MTLSETPPTDRLRTAPADRTAALAVFVVLVLTLVGRLAFAAWEQYDGPPSYDEVVAFGDLFWPMNLVVFGLSWSLGFAAQAVLAWRLGRGRGRITASIGAGLLAVGGALFALTATAHALPYDWAANHGVVDAGTGRLLVEAYATTGSATLWPFIVGAQVVIALGALVTAIGGRLSTTIPTWLLVTTVVLMVAFFAVPDLGPAVTVVLALAQAALWAALGWFGWRAAR